MTTEKNLITTNNEQTEFKRRKFIFGNSAVSDVQNTFNSLAIAEYIQAQKKKFATNDLTGQILLFKLFLIIPTNDTNQEMSYRNMTALIKYNFFKFQQINNNKKMRKIDLK